MLGMHRALERFLALASYGNLLLRMLGHSVLRTPSTALVPVPY